MPSSSPIRQEGNTVQGMAASVAPLTAGMSPDEAASALAFVNNLAQGMLAPEQYPGQSPQGQAPQGPMQAMQKSQTAPNAQTAPKEAETPQEDKGEPAEEPNPDVEALKSQVTEMDTKMKEMAKMLDTALQTSDKHRKDNEEFKKELKGIINGDNQGNTKKTAA